MQPRQHAPFTALVLLAFCVYGQNASCLEVSQIQESNAIGFAEPNNGWQQLNASNYFSGPEVAPIKPASANLLGAPFESQPSRDGGMSQQNLRSLMRPKIAFDYEWLTASDFDLTDYDLSVSVPTYPFFGPPPPMIRAGFTYTDLSDGEAFGLPADLYQYSIGFSWVRPIKDRWMVRSMLGVALATDNINTTSEAWQFRGGVFGVYEPNEKWQWVIGAIAIGRNDIPVVPAAGVIWKPRTDLKFDLTLPKPRISRLIADNGSRQQWGYVGMGLNGGTWAYQRVDGIDDQLTYGDWRVVAGWESLPTPVAGARFTAGRKFGLELGYVFSRDLEFSSDSPDISLRDAMLLGITTRF